MKARTSMAVNPSLDNAPDRQSAARSRRGTTSMEESAEARSQSTPTASTRASEGSFERSEGVVVASVSVETSDGAPMRPRASKAVVRISERASDSSTEMSSSARISDVTRRAYSDANAAASRTPTERGSRNMLVVPTRLMTRLARAMDFRMVSLTRVSPERTKPPATSSDSRSSSDARRFAAVHTSSPSARRGSTGQNNAGARPMRRSRSARRAHTLALNRFAR